MMTSPLLIQLLIGYHIREIVADPFSFNAHNQREIRNRYWDDTYLINQLVA